MRALALSVFIVGCTHAGAAPAITLVAQAPTEHVEVKSDVAVHLDTAQDAIRAGRYDDATAALLQVVCSTHEAGTAGEISRCAAPATFEVAMGWAMLGELALKRKVVLRGGGWHDARHVVTRWSGGNKPDDDDLALAEIAYSRAISIGSAKRLEWSFALASTRLQRSGCGVAFHLLAELANGESVENASASALVVQCIVSADWDRDGVNDSQTAFSRPAVREALGRDRPWVRKIYVRAIEALGNDDKCDAARVGLAQLAALASSSAEVAVARSTVAAACP